MVGSEKQVAWAEKIKSAVVSGVESDLKEITTSIGIYSAATRTTTDEIHFARLQKNSAILSAWLDSAKLNESAEFWIDNPNENAYTILKKHYRAAK